MQLFFDFDGTIVDVSRKYYHVYSAFIRHHGGAELPQGRYWDLKRSEASDRQILDASLLPDLNPALFRGYVREHIEREDALRLDRLFEGARTVLEKCFFEHTCYLISMRQNFDILQKQLQWLDVKKYFSAVLTPEPIAQKRIEPSQPSKSDALKHIDITLPSLIIGDSGMDIVTGKKHGITTCAVTTGIRSNTVLQRYEPDFIVNSLGDMEAIAQSLSALTGQHKGKQNAV